MKILNVGCGDDMYGTHRIDKFKTSATTEVSDLEEWWPYDNNFFDEIYAKSVLEHIKNVGFFVEECYRVLKPGGKIWLRTDHAGYLPFHLLSSHEHNNYLQVQYAAGNYGHLKLGDGHYHLFSESHLRLLFSKFKKIRFNYVMGGGSLMLRILAQGLPKKMGAVHIELEAKK